MPSCTSTVTFHEQKGEKSCFRAMINDALFVKLPRCFSFFVKLHFVAALFGGKKFVRDLRRAPHQLAWRIVKDTLRSCGYWVLGVHVCIRLCTCFSRKLIRRMYRALDSV